VLADSFYQPVYKQRLNFLTFILTFFSCRLLMENSHRPVIWWHLILAIECFVKSKNKHNQKTLWSFIGFWFSSCMCRFEKSEGKHFSMADSDYFVFHSPYNKVIIWLIFIAMLKSFIHNWISVFFLKKTLLCHNGA